MAVGVDVRVLRNTGSDLPANPVLGEVPGTGDRDGGRAGRDRGRHRSRNGQHLDRRLVEGDDLDVVIRVDRRADHFGGHLPQIDTVANVVLGDGSADGQGPSAIAERHGHRDRHAPRVGDDL